MLLRIGKEDIFQMDDCKGYFNNITKANIKMKMKRWKKCLKSIK
jgi:hypothetical protein